MTAFISNRASDRVNVGTFWNSPSFRSAVASSSPVGFSRAREEVGAAIGDLRDPQYGGGLGGPPQMGIEKGGINGGGS